ncbi:MAG TPA: hypothetical protein DEB39_15750 [Planctomycetaceae bacterium]|nr:hypothetical protein [Planctomycetaceae bacterium]
MEIVTSIGQITWGVVLVLLGFNALIVVHEFGHFVVARWCGVRCDKFYIWFDAFGFRFFRFQWGETEYGLGWLPLGGYVKMYGQEDNPGEVRAEMGRAKLAVADPEPFPGPETLSDDVAQPGKTRYAPNSYLGKTVLQRMTIIVAGVVMNLIFAFVFATAAYMVGVEEAAPVIGDVVPGSPAWQAGLRGGDEFVMVNGNQARTFSDLIPNLIAAGFVDLQIRREGIPELLEVHVPGWKKNNDLQKTVGIRNEGTAKLTPVKEIPDQIKNPEAKDHVALYPGMFWNAMKAFPEGCEIKKIDDVPVLSGTELTRELYRKIDRPITLTLQASEGAGDAVESVVLLPIPMKTLRAVAGKTGENAGPESATPEFAMGEITALMDDCEAKKLGIEPGDVLLSVDGRRADPLRLPYEMRLKANAARLETTTPETATTETMTAGSTTVKLLVRKKDGSEKTFDVPLLQDAVGAEVVNPQDDIACSQLGIAYRIAGLLKKDGTVGQVSALTLVQPRLPKLMPYVGTSFCSLGGDDEKQDVEYIDLGTKVDLPFLLLYALQSPQLEEGTSVRLVVDGKPEEFELANAPAWFGANRNLDHVLKKKMVLIQATGWEACTLGFEKTVDSTLLVYSVLHGLVNGSVSAKGMGGPVLILGLAYRIAFMGAAAYLMFLCIISANLAVMNILPIPMLDGGHLMFLAYEGLTGREPNPVVFEILCWLGLFLILSLMVWVCLLDFSLIKRM